MLLRSRQCKAWRLRFTIERGYDSDRFSNVRSTQAHGDFLLNWENDLLISFLSLSLFFFGVNYVCKELQRLKENGDRFLQF